MGSTVITIARTLGSEGEQVGQLVAKQLGFRYADDEIINAAAERAGVSRETVAKAERKPGLVARILDTMGQVPFEPQVYYGQAISAMPIIESQPYDELIRDVIVETAQIGNVVIVAHGAGICLAGSDGLLRVLVTASPNTRAQRLASAASVDSKRAEKAIRDSDSEREAFFRRFYDVQHEHPWHYDLVINTDTFSNDRAANVVSASAKT